MTQNPDSTARELNPPIVVAVDGSAVSYQAAAWAAIDAGLHGCRLRIVNSVAVAGGFGPGPYLTESDEQWLQVEGERVVGEAARVARAAAVGAAIEIQTEVTVEPIIAYLLRRSQQIRMMVVGSRGLGAIGRGMLGSVSTAVTRHAQCPVAVIHSATATDPVAVDKPVLVGVDGTANSVPAIELAFQEASLRKVDLIALHAWSDMTGPYGGVLPGWDAVRDQEELQFAESMAGYGERYPDVQVQRILVMDRPVRALLEQSENAQLVVVGSHGRGGFTGMLLGSTSAALLHSVDCPIVVTRKP
ncbi:universal stress protein [Nocardia huaxiensis]|uniref:Universal stress protein n=1 Tax=Nocardia huaxiensis TaxID=2755382 RepID=A0A7D6Z1S9_9NOCA|nr:universal stress protein [Nocardia huaxiensis]QLY28604.1 universal stress protein [Nocardia huaxiensis]UFS97925.1 universal stress protein [Nocardia huaxiensis]